MIKQLKTRQAKIQMDRLKKPEMILSLITIVLFIGTFVHFYRKTNSLDEETGKLIDLLAAMTKKVKETDIYAEHIRQLESSTQQLNSHINHQSRIIEECRYQIENLLESVEVLTDALVSAGHDIRAPVRSKSSLDYRDELPSRLYSQTQRHSPHTHSNTQFYSQSRPHSEPASYIHQPPPPPPRTQQYSDPYSQSSYSQQPQSYSYSHSQHSSYPPSSNYDHDDDDIAAAVSTVKSARK